MNTTTAIIFGPVPSRRLGRSIGVNNIPPKICTYACEYCQLGPTVMMQVERQAFYGPEKIAFAAQQKCELARSNGETIDYLTFVPDGEPTLDVNLEQEIDLLRPLGIPVAVITNASLIGQKDVRRALMKADWVSLKIDTVDEKEWRTVNRPHRSLSLSALREGALLFAEQYRGKLMTETMLLAAVNDKGPGFQATADFLGSLNPDTAYLSVPIRPPTADWVRPPDEHVLNSAFQIVSERVDHVEYLTGYEGNAFAMTSNVKEDILSITSVHPMRHDAVQDLLQRSGADWNIVSGMVEQGLLVETTYSGHTFYVRRFGRHAVTPRNQTISTT